MKALWCGQTRHLDYLNILRVLLTTFSMGDQAIYRQVYPPISNVLSPTIYCLVFRKQSTLSIVDCCHRKFEDFADGKKQY